MLGKGGRGQTTSGGGEKEEGRSGAGERLDGDPGPPGQGGTVGDVRVAGGFIAPLPR